MRHATTRALTCAALLCLALAACHGPTSPRYDGSYAGEMTNVTNGVYNCPDTRTTRLMTVEDGHVAYNDFRGWVTPDGGLTMDDDHTLVGGKIIHNRIAGTFAPEGFNGQYTSEQPDGFVCSYALKFRKR